MSIDWVKWSTPALVLAIAAFAITWSRPAAIALFHYLIRYDGAKSRETLLIILRSEDGKLKVKAYMEELLADKWALSRRALDIAETNADTLAQVKFTQEALQLTVKGIELSVEEVPRLIEALDRISESMHTYAEHMSKVSDFMSRSDEREKLRDKYDRGELPDRRHHPREEGTR